MRRASRGGGARAAAGRPRRPSSAVTSTFPPIVVPTGREPGRWGQSGGGASPASEFGRYVNLSPDCRSYRPMRKPITRMARMRRTAGPTARRTPSARSPSPKSPWSRPLKVSPRLFALLLPVGNRPLDSALDDRRWRQPFVGLWRYSQPGRRRGRTGPDEEAPDNRSDRENEEQKPPGIIIRVVVREPLKRDHAEHESGNEQSAHEHSALCLVHRISVSRVFCGASIPSSMSSARTDSGVNDVTHSCG